MDARLAAQIDLLRSDDWLREKARVAAAMDPAERLRIAGELGSEAMDWLALQPAGVVARLEATRRLDARAEDALRRWARGRPA